MASDRILIKTTVNLIAPAVAALEKTAELSGHTKTDVINRALQVYGLLVEADKVHGKKTALINQYGDVEVVHFT